MRLTMSTIGLLSGALFMTPAVAQTERTDALFEVAGWRGGQTDLLNGNDLPVTPIAATSSDLPGQIR